MENMDWFNAIEQPITNLRNGDCSGTLTDGSVLGDWRLPTKTELDILRSGTETVYSGPFTGVNISSYWSTTTFDSNPNAAWTVFIGGVSMVVASKYNNHPVWPVRAGH